MTAQMRGKVQTQDNDFASVLQHLCHAIIRCFYFLLLEFPFYENKTDK